MHKYWIAAGMAFAIAAPAGAAETTSGVQRTRAVYDIGACIVRADRHAAADMLRTLPLTDEPTTVQGSRLGKGARCLRGQPLETSALTLRGGIAQEMFLRDFPYFGVPPKIAPSLFARFDLPIKADATGVDPVTAAQYRLADCVIRNQAMKTEVLFRSSPGSSVEGRLIGILGPTMSACQGANATLRIKRSNFRSLLAQAAYHVSVRYWNGELAVAR